MGGYDGHPHSRPPARGFPHQAPLLSPVEGPSDLCHPTHYRAVWMVRSSWPPTDSLWKTQVPTAGICAAQWEEVGTIQVSEAGPPQTGTVLVSLEQCVPSLLCHSSHSQSSGAAAGSPKCWVVGSAQGNCVGGALGAVPHRSGWGP